jgi:hypothetical protein
MSALSIQVPFPVFAGTDGLPLDNGYVWIGVANLNPQTNPVVAYYDAALTIPAVQPLRTLNGYISRAGSPAQVYVDGNNFSILVQDSKGTMVYSFPQGTGIEPIPNNASGVVYDPAGTGAVATTVQTKLRETVSVKDFGATGDGVTDDWAAIRDALDTNPRGLYFPVGTYFLSKTLNLKRTVRMYSDQSFSASSQYPVTLKFADNIVGIFVHRTDTNASDTGVPYIETPATTGADGSIIEGILVQRGTGADVTPDGTSHGIWLKARALIRNSAVAGFAGNGVNIVADSGTTNPVNRGNANLWKIDNARIVNNYHGIFVDLGDANAGGAYNADCSSNQGWGIYDSSFLGNTYTACHTATNVLGGYKTDNSNAQNVLVGCYSETPQAQEFVQPTTIIGGFIQRTYITGDFYSLDSLPAFTGVTSFLTSSVASTGVVDAIAIQTIQNSNSLTSARHAGYRVRVGTLSGSEVNVGMFFGRGSSSSTTARHAAGIAVYDGTTGLYDKALECQGLLNQVCPGTDNVWASGGASFRWSVVYAATGAINTSDAREKQQVRSLSDAEKAVAVRLKGLIRAFKWNDAVAKKGSSARIHVGVIAQDVEAAFAAEGLNGFDYAVLCYDEWDAELDDDGNVLTSAGNRYGVRHDQLFAFIVSAL